ncbi:MAG: MATE family efflux transporter [Oscillospiraceae bacterium]|nr:MATE family efflux transporter [Oscillospiraceae bacterium]MBQ6902795.1 MATE family efflux transporter [Oscillospiraceae bacterium]
MNNSNTISQPMFSPRALVALAVPIVLDALLAIAAGLVDSAMVSSAGEAAVSAISLVDSLNIMFILLFNAVTTGGVVVTSQYIGSRDIDKARTSANQLLYGSTAIATVLMLSLLCFIPQVISLVYGRIDAAVFENAKSYFFWTLLGYPFFAVGSSCTALLRAQAKSAAALWLTGAVNILNVIGNALLIYGFDLGVAGAAISTTFSRVIWAVVGLLMLHNKSLQVHFEKLLNLRLDMDIMKRVMTIGGANGLENGLFQMGKILVASLVSSFGTIAIAANSVANTLCNIGWTTIGSFGTVLLTVVGQCMGAREVEQAKQYTKKIVNFCIILTVVLFGSVFLFRNQLVSIFDFGKEALDASAYITGAGALLTICSVYAWSFVPVAAYRAAGDTKYAVVLAVSSMFTFRVGLSYVLGHFLQMGLIGVWIGMWADWTCRTVFNYFRFRNGKWLTKKVI